MKILGVLFAWLISLVLVGCSGGGGTAGTSPFAPSGNSTPTTPAAASIDVVASAAQLGSTGDPVIITAVVKGPGNVSIAGAPVSFASDSGNLTSAATVTDATGVATAVLSAGANKTSRNIRVTVTSGDASGSVVIPVVGSVTTTPTVASIDVTSSAAQLGSNGDPVTVSAVVKGPGNIGLASVPVSFAADSGNLTAVAAVTDANGLATAKLAVGSNRSNRNITVTVTAGSVTGSIVVPVVASASSTTSSATAIDLLTSAVQAGSGGDQVTVTAIVKGAGNVSLPNTPVSFSADSGILTSPATVTDAAGTATAILSAGANKSNRDIRVTVISGTVSSSIVVPVAGTILSYVGATTVPLGTSTGVAVKAVDSRGSPIVGVTVTVTSSLGNGLSTSSLVTDVQGTASVIYTARNSGTDTLTFSGAGASANASIKVSGENFTFISPAANTQVVVGQAQEVSVRYLSGGVPQAGKDVTFASTAGRVLSSEARTDANGIARATVTASTAGPALVQATLVGGAAQATVPLEFIAVDPFNVVLQVTPTALAPNPGGATAQQAQIVATVTDRNGNPVRGVTVNFTRTSDPSAGNLSQASSVTDSNGQATVQYIAGPLSTASNGVKLQASVPGSFADHPSPVGNAELTVNQSALFIALGTGNTISNLDDQTYKKDWVVYVTDANGIAVPNVSLTIKVLPVGYCKGELVYNGTTWVIPSSARYFANEDLNFNGVLDSGEDANENGVLDPGNVISVTTAISTTAASSGTVKTDSTGRATVSLVYAESYAPWVRVKLRAEAVVTGTESSKEAIFFVTGAAPDFSSETVPPAGKVSPFGSTVSLSGTSCLSAP